MNKKLICKLMALSILTTSVATSAPLYAFATPIVTSQTMDNTTNEQDEVLSTLTSYLNAFKNFDIDTIVNISEDLRCSTTSEYKKQLRTFKSDINDHLKSFEIKDFTRLVQ